MESILKLLKSNPVIAAVRDTQLIDTALDSDVQVIFMMGGQLSRIREVTARVREAGKHIYLHVELLKGLGRDQEAITYIAREIHPHGVVSTKPHLVQAAARCDLSTILQIFMIDSQAFDTGLKNIAGLNPDGIEIMPGLIPSVMQRIKSHTDLPLIAAGLIKQPHEVETMLRAGCDGVTVSEQSLWYYPPRPCPKDV